MITGVSRRPVVGVMGSGTDSWPCYSHALGCWLAQRGVHLLTGGGGGVMAAVAQAFVETTPRQGLSLAIVPTEYVDGRFRLVRPGYPNPWVEVPIVVPLGVYDPRQPVAVNRNVANILSSDVVVVLPGGPGTAQEKALAEAYDKPLVVLSALSDGAEGPDGSGAPVDRLQAEAAWAAALGALDRLLPHEY
ncbi:MAG: hypothetical protein R2857_10405 [Vampirovibrionales bacterium]